VGLWRWAHRRCTRFRGGTHAAGTGDLVAHWAGEPPSLRSFGGEAEIKQLVVFIRVGLVQGNPERHRFASMRGLCKVYDLRPPPVRLHSPSLGLD